MALKKIDVEKIFDAFKERNPNPKTELHYATPYQLLIAVILSAQCTDVAVNKVTPRLFLRAPDAGAMANLGVADIRGLIRSIGLNNTKAKHVRATSIILRDTYGGALPRTRKELELLPGVGQKTAGVVMNVVYGSQTLPVDTHVFRLANRLGIVKTKTPNETEHALLKAIPTKYLNHAHHWLILHGRYVCIARKPRCERCFLTDRCAFFASNNDTG